MTVAEESTSAALRRVEQERDEALTRASDLEQARVELAEAKRTLDLFLEDNQDLRSARDGYFDRATKAEAELASARTELEQLRGAENERDAMAVDYAQLDLDRNALQAQVEKLRAALQRADRALLSSPATGAALDRAFLGPAEIYAYDAWQCTTCSNHYTHQAEHPHPLTPVRVTNARRPTDG